MADAKPLADRFAPLAMQWRIWGARDRDPRRSRLWLCSLFRYRALPKYLGAPGQRNGMRSKQGMIQASRTGASPGINFFQPKVLFARYAEQRYAAVDTRPPPPARASTRPSSASRKLQSTSHANRANPALTDKRGVLFEAGFTKS